MPYAYACCPLQPGRLHSAIRVISVRPAACAARVCSICWASGAPAVNHRITVDVMHCPALDCMGVVRQAPDARLSADLVDVQVVATTASAGGDSSSEPAPKRPKLGGAAAEAAVSGQVDVSVAGQDAANGNGTGECVDPAVPTAHAYASASAGDDGAQCTDLPIKSDNALGCPEVLRQVSPDRCVTVLDGPRAIDFLHQVELMCEKQPEIYTGFCQVLEETCQALAAAQDRQSTAADQTRLAAVTTSSSTSSSLRSRSLAEPNHLMGKGCYFLVFVPTMREIRDFYREM
eukprot:SAG31_NODE_76_length_27534_cov_13.661868_12_plen_289_part_00